MGLELERACFCITTV